MNELVGQDQRHAYGYAGIRDVERGPMKIFIIKIQKIDDLLVKDPIDKIADRPAEQ